MAGIKVPAAKLGEFLRNNKEFYEPRATLPLESWSASKAAAANYAKTTGKGWSVMLEVKNPREAADFSALARAYAKQVAKQPKAPLATGSEWVYTTGRKFKVVHRREDKATRTNYFTLEEAR